MLIRKLVYATSLATVYSPWERTWRVSTYKVDEVVDEESETLIGDISNLVGIYLAASSIPSTSVKTKDLTRMWCNCADTYWLVMWVDLARVPGVNPQMELTPTLAQLCERYKIASETMGEFHWLLLGSAESPPN